MDLSGYHGEHKTWAPRRKPDRRNYSTDGGRAELRRWDRSTRPVKDWFDMATKDELRELLKEDAFISSVAQGVWQHQLTDLESGRKKPAGRLLARRPADSRSPATAEPGAPSR